MPDRVLISDHPHTAAQLFAVVVLVALVVAMTTGVYWVFFNEDPPFTTPGPVIVRDITGTEDYTFSAGDTMYINRSICSRQATAQPLSVTRHLRSMAADRAMYAITGALNTILEPGCTNTTSAVLIPPNVAPGFYEIVSVAVYRNNPFQNGVATYLPSPQIEIQN